MEIKLLPTFFKHQTFSLPSLSIPPNCKDTQDPWKIMQDLVIIIQGCPLIMQDPWKIIQEQEIAN